MAGLFLCYSLILLWRFGIEVDFVFADSNLKRFTEILALETYICGKENHLMYGKRIRRIEKRI